MTDFEGEKSGSGAENFDRAIGLTNQVMSTLKPKPVVKLGLYCNLPLFRK